MTFVSHAQNLEDVILWRALKNLEKGFYIDVGAWDPRVDSVTLAFYERGWRGINIEPDPAKHAALMQERPEDINLRMALAEVAGSKPFYMFEGTGWSTLNPAIARQHKDAGHVCEEQFVQVSRLADVCELHAPSEIHFLKVDVEGAEGTVLSGADFKRHRPWIILVEATLPNSSKESHGGWEQGILEANYEFAYFDGLNRYYVAQEHAAELLKSFSNPPNVFDDFVSMAVLRRTLHYHQSSSALGELKACFDQVRQQTEEQFTKVQEEQASRHRQELENAEVKLREAELRAVEAEMKVRLAAVEASAAQPASATKQPIEDIHDRHAVLDPRASGPKHDVYYDASLILHYGLKPPVGIVRVEHYVAELLSHEPSIRLEFVVFDTQIGAYRRLTVAEQAQLKQILFARYRGSQGGEIPQDKDHNVAEAAVAQAIIARPPLKARVRNVARMHPEQFEQALSSYLLRKMPIRENQPYWRRFGMRGMRRSVALGMRLSYRGLKTAAEPLHAGKQMLAHLTRADSALPVLQEKPPVAENTTPRGAHAFREGDTLITIANTWDYVDYSYLTSVVRKDKIRLVSVIYDVIAMEMPFTTPASIHIYHRHWVEMGHLAAHLVAISRHSLDTYRRFIAEPNDVDPPMTYAYLPNFLYERREEIGEKPVQELLGKRFVVFCSTIETRKNHQTLLHAWERLRQQVDADQLPILVFVGGWGWGTETVRLLSERNWRLRDHLRILNNISDAELIWLYRNSCFTAFPALSEGFGLAAAESLSFGTPVVVADCPALIEATEGLMPVIDPLDLPSWVTELKRMITDEAYLAGLRQKASQYRGVDYNEFAHAIRDAVLQHSNVAPVAAE